MSAETFDLGRIIHPIAPATFFAEYWDKKPLLIQRRQPRYFEGLFSTADLDPLFVNYGRAHGYDIRLAKRGGSPAAIELPDGEAPSLDRIYSAYRDGYTVNLNDFTPYHSAMRRLVHSLLGEFGTRPRPNLFLTPPNARGFDLHFDPHDVLVMQLGGAKEWRVYERIASEPTHKHSKVTGFSPEEAGAPLIDTILEAGDVLYVPRGFVHEAYTANEHSLHVTLGLKMGTYLDVLERMVETIGWKNPKLRQSIPVGSLFGRSRAEMVGAMLELIRNELTASVVSDAMADFAAEVLLRAPPVEAPRFVDAAALQCRDPVIELDTPLVKPAGLVASLRIANGRVTMYVQGASVEGPWRIQPALEYVAKTASLRARDFPGTLKDEEKLVLARRLVREGVLRRG